MEIEVSMTGGQAERFDQMVTKFGSNPTRFLPVHVEVDKEYNVEVFDLSRKCDGIAKVKGFVVFVKGSGVGEKVKLRLRI